jgi:hypothetical protein
LEHLLELVLETGQGQNPQLCRALNSSRTPADLRGTHVELRAASTRIEDELRRRPARLELVRGFRAAGAGRRSPADLRHGC